MSRQLARLTRFAAIQAIAATISVLVIAWFVDGNRNRLDAIEDRTDPSSVRARAAYEELGLAVSQSRADIISAHDRINAIYWQLDIVLKTCPGQEMLPPPPWPVREPQWAVPFTPRDWDALYVEQIQFE